MFKIAYIPQLLASTCLGIFKGYNNSQFETSILLRMNDMLNQTLSNTLTLTFVYSESITSRGKPVTTIDNWNNYDVCIFVYIFTHLLFYLGFTSIIINHDKRKDCYTILPLEINLTMTSTASECTHFLPYKIFSDSSVITPRLRHSLQ